MLLFVIGLLIWLQLGVCFIFQTVCLSTRKQKELELSILNGVIQGWEGTEACSLGDAIKIGSVAFGSEHKDRYLMLFSTHIVILSVSQRLSSFIYEVRKKNAPFA